MAAPVRILAVIAVLAGGLVVVKGLGLAAGVSDAWAATTQEAEQNALPQTETPFLPALSAPDPDVVCPVVEVRPSEAAFAERVGASPGEIEVLRSLAQRRRELDARGATLDTRESMLAAAEIRIDERIRELRRLRDEIETIVDVLSESEEAEMARLVAIYRTMDARDAAPRLAALDERTQVHIAARMAERSFAGILAAMEVDAAARLTLLLAERSALPATAADLELRLAQEG